MHLSTILEPRSDVPGCKDRSCAIHGNLCLRPVSNAVRTRATSHPCERGAGLLEILSNPQEIGAAKSLSSRSVWDSAERWRLAEKNVEVCDVARAQKSF